LNDVGKVADVAKLADVGKTAETASVAGRLGGLAEDAGTSAASRRALSRTLRSTIARGEPFAFGIGDRSARATAIIDRSAQALGPQRGQPGRQCGLRCVRRVTLFLGRSRDRACAPSRSTRPPSARRRQGNWSPEPMSSSMPSSGSRC
jgi:hypothetical protein